MEIIKEFYGLNTSGSRFHERFSYNMRKLGYFPSKEDNDVCMKDEGNNYSYLYVFVEKSDILFFEIRFIIKKSG